MKPATMINCFEVPPGREDEFYAMWSKVNEYQKTQPGFLAHKMHRALAPEAKFRFINVVQFETFEQYQTAVASKEFLALAEGFGPRWRDFRRTGLGHLEVVEELQRPR